MTHRDAIDLLHFSVLRDSKGTSRFQAGAHPSVLKAKQEMDMLTLAAVSSDP
jgi:hypothetical protein